MKATTAIYLLLLTTAISFLVGLKTGCNTMHPGQADTVRVTTVQLQYDTVVKTITSKDPTQVASFHIPFFNVPDSIAVYNATCGSCHSADAIHRGSTAYIYADTLRDQNLEATIRDSIFKDRIAGRLFGYKILRPDSVITNTITITVPGSTAQAAWWVGAGYTQAGANPFYGPEILYQRRRFAFGGSMGFGSTGTMAGAKIYYLFHAK